MNPTELALRESIAARAIRLNGPTTRVYTQHMRERDQEMKERMERELFKMLA